MEASNLPLFSTNNSQSKTSVKLQPIITEDQIITPAIQVLNSVTLQPIDEKHSREETTQSISKSLDDLFPEQQYDEKNLKRAKAVLGELANEFTPQQLKDALVEIQCLADSWLDDFERITFNGLTLQELLHEKGGV